MRTLRDPEMSRLAAIEAAERIRLLVQLLGDDDALKLILREAQSTLLSGSVHSQERNRRKKPASVRMH